jgi:uncharacterized protein
MAEPAVTVRESGLWLVVKKRWRAWLRAFHRDFGYLAIGFTVIYAVSGIAQNHIEDWGDVSYKTFESQKTIAPIPDAMPDEQAIAAVAVAAKLGTPTASTRAGDEIRLEYANGSKVTAIGTEVTIQSRERRAFIGAANWLHTARQKKGWKYVADTYAVLLLYLAISGIFMIKGKLGLKGRGAILITIGVAVPITAVLLSSPQPKTPDVQDAPVPMKIAVPPAVAPTPAPAATPEKPDDTPAENSDEVPALPTVEGVDTSGIKFLPSEEEGSADAKKKPCDPFGSMHGCAK